MNKMNTREENRKGDEWDREEIVGHQDIGILQKSGKSFKEAGLIESSRLSFKKSCTFYT